MANNKTIAVITSSPSKASAIANAFATERCNLIVLAKETDGYDKMIAAIKRKRNTCKVELHNCMKDGCWEADAIILDIEDKEKNEVVNAIKEVAVQKVIVNISRECNNEILQQLLPYSKVKTLPDVPSSFKTIIEDEEFFYGK